MILSTLDRLDAGPFTKLARTMSRNHQVQVELSGMACNTDGKTIRIPANADYLQGEDARILHGMLDHEVAHVWEEHDAMSRRERGAACQTPLEVMKACASNTEKLMVNVFEDIRIERRAALRYLGVAENLRMLAAHTTTRLRASKATGDVWQTLASGIIMAAQGQPVDWIPANLAPVMTLLQPEIEDSKTTETVEETHALAVRAIAKIKSAHEEAEKQAQENDKRKPEDEGGGEPGPFSSLTPGEAKELAKALRGVMGDAKVADLLDRVKAEMQDTAIKDAVSNERYVTEPTMASKDAVVEADQDMPAFERARNAVMPEVAGLKARLTAILRIRCQSRLVGDRERGILDNSQLYGMRTGNTRVFAERSKEEKLETAVSILVDCSGSMGDGNHFGERAYYARQTCIALAETFQALQIPFEVLGFTNTHDGRGASHGPGGLKYGRIYPFQFLRFKGFSEPYAPCRARFGSITGMEENSDGEAVLFTARRLAARKEARKLLFVVSDGLPTGGTCYELPSKFLHEAIKRVSASGIEVYGIGAAYAAVTRFYGKENGAKSIVVTNLSKLASDVYGLVKDRLVRRVSRRPVL